MTIPDEGMLSKVEMKHTTMLIKVWMYHSVLQKGMMPPGMLRKGRKYYDTHSLMGCCYKGGVNRRRKKAARKGLTMAAQI